MAGNKKKKNRSSKTYLRLTVEEPFERGGVWEVLTTAFVSRSGKTVNDEAIQFYLDGMKFGSPVRTDADGRAQQTLKVPLELKRVSVEAQVVGQRWVDRKVVPFSTEPPKKPHSFDVQLVGADGNYRIVVMVRGKDDSPIKGVKVQFLNAATGKVVHTPHTDESGIIAVLKTVPDEKVLELEIVVHGLHAPSKTKLLRLSGKRADHEIEPPPPRERPKLEVGQSLKDGWESRRKGVDNENAAAS